MIIDVTREYGSYGFDVTPLADNGEPLPSKGDFAHLPVTGSHCMRGVVWDEVGRLIVAHGGGSRGDTGEVTIRYADRNSLPERIRRSQEAGK
jgi:hypothetical protein